MPTGRDHFDPRRRGRADAAQARLAATLARLDSVMGVRRRERQALMQRLDAARGDRAAALGGGWAALEGRLAAATGRDFDQMGRMLGARRLPRPGARRRGLDGGEPVPALPRPKPLPLLGGAEAPLD